MVPELLKHLVHRPPRPTLLTSSESGKPFGPCRIHQVRAISRPASLPCDYKTTTIDSVRGTKKEVSPGVWRLRVYAGRRPNGTPIQVTETLHGPDKKEGSGSRLADRRLAKMVSDVSSGKLGSGAETFGTLLDRWLEHCDSLGRSPTTMKKYRQIVAAVVRPELGKVRLSKLTAGHLDKLYAKLTEKGNKAITVRHVHALIGAALHQAERWDLVDRNVALRASPPVVRRAQVEAPSPAEVQALLVEAEKVEPALAILLLLAALTGARRGELCALRWSDVDLKTGTLTIARSVYETDGGGWAEKPTKTHQSRRIGLDDLALEALRRHRDATRATAGDLHLTIPPDAFLFSRSPVGSEPIRPATLTAFTTRMATKAKVDTHLHALRHFSATQAIAAGYDPVTVGGRLGHADPSITLRVYSHVLEQRDRELATTLGKTLTLPIATRQ
jgi:integrase